MVLTDKPLIRRFQSASRDARVWWRRNPPRPEAGRHRYGTPYSLCSRLQGDEPCSSREEVSLRQGKARCLWASPSSFFGKRISSDPSCIVWSGWAASYTKRAEHAVNGGKIHCFRLQTAFLVCLAEVLCFTERLTGSLIGLTVEVCNDSHLYPVWHWTVVLLGCFLHPSINAFPEPHRGRSLQCCIHIPVICMQM